MRASGPVISSLLGLLLVIPAGPVTAQSPSAAASPSVVPSPLPASSAVPVAVVGPDSMGAPPTPPVGPPWTPTLDVPFDAVSVNVVACADGFTALAAGQDLRNGVLVHHPAPVDGAALIIRTSRAALPGLLAGQMGGITLEGDQSVLGQLLSVLQNPDPDFAIVTP